LVAEGFQVNVALLPEGTDPDTFVRRQGGKAYVERLTGSRPYLEFLLDRAAAQHDLTRPDSRRAFLNAMLTVAATIPDIAARDQFADRLAHKARITESVVRDEIRKAAAQRKTEAPAVAVPATARLRPAEQGLLWLLAHRPVEGLAAIGQLEEADLEGLLAGPVFSLAASLADVPPDVLPGLLRERLNEGERALLERAARPEAETASASGCVQAIKRLRYERECAAVQDEIDRLQDVAAPGPAGAPAGPPPDAGDRTLRALWTRKKELLQKLEQ
jgi:DNA primase